MDGAVPRSKCAGEYRHDAWRPGKGRGSIRVGAEAVRVGAPLDLEYLRSWRVPWQDRGVWCDDEIGVPAEALPPATHRLHDERAIQKRLRRSGVVDHRGVHFQNRAGTDSARRQNPFPAEVVVPLDDDV